MSEELEQTTQVNNLSSQVQEIFADIQDTSTQTLDLSAEKVKQYKAALNKIKTDAQALLSAIEVEPLNPYEKLKLQYFDRDYEFPTFLDLPDPPEDFNIESVNEALSAISQKITDSCMLQLSCLSCCEETPENFAQGFTKLSGNEIVINNEACKEYLIFTEIVKSIPVELVYVQPDKIAKKLLLQYTKLLHKL